MVISDMDKLVEIKAMSSLTERKKSQEMLIDMDKSVE